MQKKGFSLVEVIIVLMITGLIAIIVYKIVSNVFVLSSDLNTKIVLEEDAQLSMEVLGKDLASISIQPCFLRFGSNANTLSFFTTHSLSQAADVKGPAYTVNKVKYSLSKGKLIRSERSLVETSWETMVLSKHVRKLKCLALSQGQRFWNWFKSDLPQVIVISLTWTGQNQSLTQTKFVFIGPQ